MNNWWDDYQAKKKARLTELKESIRANETTETSCEDVIICPYCGSDDSDDRYDGEGEHEYYCGHCGEEYTCQVHVSISYSTKRKAVHNTQGEDK